MTADGVLNISVLIGIVIVGCALIADVALFLYRSVRKIGSWMWLWNLPEADIDWEFPCLTIPAVAATFVIFMVLMMFYDGLSVNW